MRTITFAAGIALIATMAQSDTLTVYAPDYFGSQWGPGPAIEAAFETKCGCDLEYLTGDVMPRLALEGQNTKADVVIGLSQDETARARGTGLFAPHGVDTAPLTLPVDWTDTDFLPFDWSYVAFVYDNTKMDGPTSFEALLNLPDETRIVIQDPRASVSGQALLMWVKALYGDDAAGAWERLAPKILTVTKGWSEAYGLFTDGEADMVLSFTTSPAYHVIAEGDETKSAAIFDEGHYLYVELAGKIAGTDNPDLADQFMDFIMTPEFQTIIPQGNWSYPAALDRAQWPQGFQDLPMPDKAIFFDETKVSEIRSQALDEWRAALSR